MTPSNRWLHTGWLAGLVFALALGGAGAQLEGYEHARHSVAVLGSRASPVAAVFNATGFELPGVLLALFAATLRSLLRRDGAPFAARLAADLMLIAGLAFAAQGVLPLDLSDPDGPASQRHVVAQMLAPIAMLASMALLAAGLHRAPEWRRLAPLGAAFAAALAGSMLWPALGRLPGAGGGAGLCLRVSLLLFFAWPALVGVLALRRQPPL